MPSSGQDSSNSTVSGESDTSKILTLRKKHLKKRSLLKLQATVVHTGFITKTCKQNQFLDRIYQLKLLKENSDSSLILKQVLEPNSKV